LSFGFWFFLFPAARFPFKGLGVWAYGSGLRVKGVAFGVTRLKFEVRGFRASDLGFRVRG